MGQLKVLVVLVVTVAPNVRIDRTEILAAKGKGKVWAKKFVC